LHAQLLISMLFIKLLTIALSLLLLYIIVIQYNCVLHLLANKQFYYLTTAIILTCWQVNCTLSHV